MNRQHQALRIVREAAGDGRLDELCDRYGLDLVSVFGSVVDDDVEDPADIDIAVRFEAGGDQDIVGVVNAFIELLGVDMVDVMNLNRAGVVARARALGAGAEPLYERKGGGYALAQMAALTEEMETAHMRYLDIELLAGR